MDKIIICAMHNLNPDETEYELCLSLGVEGDTDEDWASRLNGAHEIWMNLREILSFSSSKSYSVKTVENSALEEIRITKDSNDWDFDVAFENPRNSKGVLTLDSVMAASAIIDRAISKAEVSEEEESPKPGIFIGKELAQELYVTAGDVSNAIDTLREAVEVERRSGGRMLGRVLNDLGNAYVMGSNTDNALACFKELIEVDPTDFAARRMLQHLSSATENSAVEHDAVSACTSPIAAECAKLRAIGSTHACGLAVQLERADHLAVNVEPKRFTVGNSVSTLGRCNTSNLYDGDCYTCPCKSFNRVTCIWNGEWIPISHCQSAACTPTHAVCKSKISTFMRALPLGVAIQSI